MSSNADHNYEMIEFVAEGLGDELLSEVAFVGGCTTAMLVTNDAVQATLLRLDKVSDCAKYLEFDQVGMLRIR